MRPLLPSILLIALSACSPKTEKEPVVSSTTDNLAQAIEAVKAIVTDTTPLTGQPDSLSYYLGFCEGLTYRVRVAATDSAMQADIRPEHYLYGLYTALQTDSTSTSYAAGVEAAASAARYVDYLERHGVAINRQLLVETVINALNNPAPDSTVIIEADAAANRLIVAQMK